MKTVILLSLFCFTTSFANALNLISPNDVIKVQIVNLYEGDKIDTGFAFNAHYENIGLISVVVACQNENTANLTSEYVDIFAGHVAGNILRPNETLVIKNIVYKCNRL